MNKNEFFSRITDLADAFPGAISTDPKHLRSWFEIVQPLSDEEVGRAIDLIKRESVTIMRGSNIGAMILQHARPKVTEATYESVLSHAVSLFRGVGDPYAYLKNIDARLLRMAEENDLFNRDLSASDTRWIIRSIAKQHLERIENQKRGYREPEPLPPERQITGPAKALTDEDRERGRIRLAELVSGLGQKKALAQ